MKKQKAKKAGGAKKKEEKTDPAEAESSKAPEKAAEKADEAVSESNEATGASPPPLEEDEPTELPKSTTAHGRKPSVAIESRLRSASFYSGEAGGTPTSPTPVTPGGSASGDIYRKQAQRIEELEKENKRLLGEVEEKEKRWKKGEEELEELREAQGDVALAVERGKEADKLVCPSSTYLSPQQVLILFAEVRSGVSQAPVIPPSDPIFEEQSPCFRFVP